MLKGVGAPSHEGDMYISSTNCQILTGLHWAVCEFILSHNLPMHVCMAWARAMSYLTKGPDAGQTLPSLHTSEAQMEKGMGDPV